MIERKQTRKIKVGNLFIGGDAPITVQSMCNTRSDDIDKTLVQIKSLEQAGCEIIRLAVFNKESASAIKEYKKHTDIPLVADIHFDYKLAIASIEAGIDKLRINPGNIGDDSRVKEVVSAAKEYCVPIRVGVNSGSIEKETLNKYGNTAKALCESALYHVNLLEKLGFYETVISVKASDVIKNYEAYRYMSDICDYPLHLGVTEAGTLYKGTIASSVGIGALLLNGIGDTIRVSLTGDITEEVKAGKEILYSLGLRENTVKLISCPTCGRCRVDLVGMANRVEAFLENKTSSRDLRIAVMGCIVNGPGEAKDADIGIAGGDGKIILFEKGEIIGSYKTEEGFNEFLNRIDKLL